MKTLIRLLIYPLTEFISLFYYSMFHEELTQILIFFSLLIVFSLFLLLILEQIQSN